MMAGHDDFVTMVDRAIDTFVTDLFQRCDNHDQHYFPLAEEFVAELELLFSKLQSRLKGNCTEGPECYACKALPDSPRSSSPPLR